MSAIQSSNSPIDFRSIRLDVAGLVGHSISLFSDQYSGKELTVRVLSVQQATMLIDGAGSRTAMDNMVSNSQVTIRFLYRDQLISVRAQFKRSQGGRLTLHLDEQVTPLMQRRFTRVAMVATVNLVPLPKVSYGNRHLSQLRWIQTESINFSAGGVLLSIPSYLEQKVLVLCNLAIEKLEFPALVIGLVRHCRQADPGHFHTGIEFMTPQRIHELLPPDRVRELPRAPFDYSAELRKQLNIYLSAHDQDVAR